jgi:hypothetical protein
MDIKKVFLLVTLLTVQSLPPALSQENYNWQGCVPGKFGKVCFKVFSDNEDFTTQFVVHGKRYTLQGAAVAGDPKNPKSGAPLSTFSPDGRGMIFQPVLLRGLRPPTRDYYLVIDTKTGNVYSVDGAVVQPGKDSNYMRLLRIEARWIPQQPHTWATVQPDGTFSDPVQFPN